MGNREHSDHQTKSRMRLLGRQFILGIRRCPAMLKKVVRKKDNTQPPCLIFLPQLEPLAFGRYFILIWFLKIPQVFNRSRAVSSWLSGGLFSLTSSFFVFSLFSLSSFGGVFPVSIRCLCRSFSVGGLGAVPSLSSSGRVGFTTMSGVIPVA